jgi:hypothetical protein
VNFIPNHHSLFVVQNAKFKETYKKILFLCQKNIKKIKELKMAFKVGRTSTFEDYCDNKVMNIFL